MRAGGGGVPRTLPLPMEGVKLLRDGPLAKAAFFCCDFVKFCLTFPQKMTNIYSLCKSGSQKIRELISQ